MAPDDRRGHGPDRRPGTPRSAIPSRPDWRAPAVDPRPKPVSRREDRAERSLGLTFVRYVLPGVVVLAGVVAMAFGTDTSLEGGAGLIGAGLAIYLVNWLFRIGAQGEAERDAEDRAREYFDRHGRWPDGS